MKTILSILLLLSQTTFANQRYYFDAVSGDDATSVNSISTPWQTIAKLNSIFSGVNPGDSILFKRGGTFYGTITISRSGSAVLPIVIGAYGIGADPVITGMVPLTWVSAGNNLWRSNEALKLGYLCLVTVNDAPAGIGRWPNLDNGNGGYDSIRATTSKTITDKIGLKKKPSPGEPTYFIGAQIVVRTTRWLLDKHPITGYDAANSIITFDPSSTNEVVTTNKGYFIQDDSTVLDKQNEWWYNVSTKKIKMYSSGSPANVSAANLAHLLITAGESYITVGNIKFSGCNSDAINLSGGSNIIIQNCTMQNVGRNAIKTVTPHCSFLHNTMVDIMSKGVWILKSADHTIFRYNTVRNVSQMVGGGTSQQEDNFSSYSGDGVYIKADNVTVEYNTFINMGYAAVHLTKVDSAIIRYNFIDTVCNVYDDGGGIYTYTGDPYSNHGRKITNNIILHGIGAFDGSGVNLQIAEGAGVAGIYTDRNSSDIEIDSNTVAYFEKGIFMNYGCARLKITNNTLYNNIHGFQVNTRLKDDDKTRNLTITGNIALAATKPQCSMYTYSDDGDVLNLFGTIDFNYYAKPLNEAIIMSYQTDRAPNTERDITLPAWQTKFPEYDAHSKKSPLQVTDPSQLKFEYNATNANKTISLNGNYEDVKGNKASNSITLKPFTSTVLIKTSGGSPNTAPKISLTSPLANAKFTAPASINISANASDSDGSIAKVDFYNDTTLLGSDSTMPYTFIWNKVARGNYSLIGKATDNGGLVTTSDTIHVSVNNSSGAPTVSITSPSDNAKFTAPASINITAFAADSNGSVAKVDFYNGSALLGSDSTSPYSFTWNNVVAGNYSLTAKATGNDSLVTTSDTVNVFVKNPDDAPTVSITTPSSDTNFIDPVSIRITAAAADSGGSIAKVDFYNDSTLIFTSFTTPYGGLWKSVPTGSYHITAVATNNTGNKTTSAPVHITVVHNRPPEVNITSPADGATYAAPATGVTIIVSADAVAHGNKIKTVKFYNGTTLIHTEENAPYSWNWNDVTAGNYTITAEAIDDNNLATISDTIHISVTNKINEAPTVSITSPSANAKFVAPASIKIDASATDADGSIATVEFYNGNTLLGTEHKIPYTITWTNVAPGNYSLTARATDNNGLVTISSAVDVVVKKANVAPKVSITSPSANAKFISPASIKITASATDAGGSISKVDFYIGSRLLGTLYSGNPYSITWTNVAPGNYVLRVKATDNGGLVTYSSPVRVTVTKGKTAASSRSSGDDQTLAGDKPKNLYEDNLNGINIKIWPNPAGNVLSLFTNKLVKDLEMDVSIYSISGTLVKTVKHNAGSEVIQVNVSSFKAGFYVIKLSTKDGIIYKQFEKQ